MKYHLSLNSRQIELMQKAIDLYVRLGIGQFHEVADVLNKMFSSKDKFIDFSHPLYLALTAAKQEFTGHVENSSFGICSPEVSNSIKVLYDVEAVLRHAISNHEKPILTHSVWRHTPLHLGSEPLPEYKVEEENG